jgi:hypothetical protein
MRLSVKIKVSYTEDSELAYVCRNLAPRIKEVKHSGAVNERGFKRAYIRLSETNVSKTTN